MVIKNKSEKKFVFVHPNPLRLKKGAIQDQDKQAWKKKRNDPEIRITPAKKNYYLS